VKHFSRELENNQMVLKALLSVAGTKILSEYPRNHTLTRVDTLASFDTVAESHKKRGFYFSGSLEEEGITVIPERQKSGNSTPKAIRQQAASLCLCFIARKMVSLSL
jgi:Sep-tRNA:Cys-tRNA synthetase